MEFNKQERKIILQIIEKGLFKELTDALDAADAILIARQTDDADDDPRTAFNDLTKHITDANKRIARRYDTIKPSDYIFVIMQQMNEGLVNTADIKELPESMKKMMSQWRGLEMP